MRLPVNTALKADVILKKTYLRPIFGRIFPKNRVYVPAIFVINKIDIDPGFGRKVKGKFVGISADKKKESSKFNRSKCGVS